MDKNKIIEGAAKLVAKGAYDKAIKEYQKVLEADPKDVRVLQKMGELYQKKNDNAQAAHYFTKVAESYSSDGFFLKAVALYKQVLKLNPNLLDVNLKLAELHQQLGLMSEAMAYFQLVANHYDKNGDTKASLETLKKMVDLDPENVASRIKLAELFARENMNGEALPEFKRAAEYLKRHNRTDDYLRVAERICAIEPENFVLSKELAQSYLAKGDQKRALARLQICFKQDSRDVEILNLLAQAFQGLGQTAKTVSVYKELAKVYQDRGRTSDVEEIWRKVSQLDPSDPDLAARRESSRPPAPPSRPTQAPAPAPAPARAAPAPSAPPPAPAPPPPAAGPGREQLPKLLTETDVYVKYGLHDKALEHLRKIFSIDPENLDAHEKAYAIYVAAGQKDQAAEQLLNVLRLCTRRSDVGRAQPYLQTILQQNPGHPEVPAFLAVLQAGQRGAVAHAEPISDEEIIVGPTEEVFVAEPPEDALARSPEELALVDSEELVEDDGVITVEDETVEDEGAVVVEDEADEPFALAAPPAYDDEPIAFDEGSEEVVEEPAFASDDDETTDSGVGMVEEAETFEFDSAPVDEFADEPPTQAFDLAPEPKTEVPAPPPPQAIAPPPPARAPAPLPPRAAPPAPVPAKPAPAPAPIAAKPAAKPPPPAAPPAKVAAKAPPPPPPPADDELGAEECDEAAFFLEQGELDEAREILETVAIAYPNNQRAKELLAKLDALEAAGATDRDALEEPTHIAPPPQVTPVAGEQDAFDLAAELAGEIGDFGEESAAPADSSGDFQISVDEVFAEFKKGLEKVVKPEDVDTHYDLGIAYKEMGLTDDAIGEFEVARQGCQGKKKEIDCLTMIGMLQLMKGEPAAAVASFKQAMGSEHAVGEAAKALGFELGAAYEAAGELGRALYHFQRVEKLDAKYRDVGGNVARLAAQTSPEDDPVAPAPPAKASSAAAPKPGAPAPAAAPKPGTRKVGYV